MRNFLVGRGGLALAVTVLGLALVACGSNPSGSLSVIVQGLPAGTNANVSVTGPGSYASTVTATSTLSGLTPGSYLVTANTATTAGAIVDSAYAGTGGGSVTVSTGTTATATVTYSARPGSGMVWTTSSSNDVILGYSAAQLASGGALSASTQLTTSSFPNGIAVDASGDVWATIGTTLAMFTPSQLASSGTPTPQVVITSDGTSLSNPLGLTFDAAGDLWVADSGNDAIEKYTPAQLAASGSPTPITIAATGGSINNNFALAFDSAGNAWVSNVSSNTLVKFTPAQLAASGTPTPTTTITATGSSLDRPEGMAFDASGNLWVANEGSSTSTLVRFTPTQQSAGGSLVPSVTISSGALDSPVGLAFDNSGALWVAQVGGANIIAFAGSDLAATGTVAPTVTITDTNLSGVDVPFLAFNP